MNVVALADCARDQTFFFQEGIDYPTACDDKTGNYIPLQRYSSHEGAMVLCVDYLGFPDYWKFLITDECCLCSCNKLLQNGDIDACCSGLPAGYCQKLIEQQQLQQQ